MNTYLIDTSELVVIDDEPRVKDIDLAIWLGYVRPLDIRENIARNRDELEAYGSFPCRTENPGIRGGRPGKAYYLNEGQALVLCALSRTPKAAQVRKALIDVFMAYRSGKLVHVKEHRRKLPARAKPKDTFDSNMSCVQAFSGQRDGTLVLLASVMTRLDELEKRP